MTSRANSAVHTHEHLSRLIQENAGVLHRREIPPDIVPLVRRELNAGRWQQLGRDVVVTHNGPLDQEQRQLAALKASPPRSALSGLTAAELDGLVGFTSPVIHVTQPCGTRRSRMSGVEVHYSRILWSEDVHPLKVPRRTRLPRSLVDAASWYDPERMTRAVILAGVQQRLVTPAGLQEALSRRGPCRRHALISEAIVDAEGGLASVPERDFDVIVRRFDLPEPTCQRVLRHPDGRRYLDADWAEFELAAEIDGRPHMSVELWDADLDRANEIAMGSRTLLRFTSYAVRHRSVSVGTTLTRALMARGWPGPSRT
ncbi:hypothetical protein [Haloactinopolyspora alba]|uniref:hypothetical protein n=1 Tax=Haloactinopolyspora alba TaxID=648780 RepID=UPI00101D28C4|nr:hypothetical protein [Haloactinopolyspora alba]